MVIPDIGVFSSFHPMVQRLGSNGSLAVMCMSRGRGCDGGFSLEQQGHTVLRVSVAHAGLVMRTNIRPNLSGISLLRRHRIGQQYHRDNATLAKEAFGRAACCLLCLWAI